jgi:hypothetical protein
VSNPNTTAPSASPTTGLHALVGGSADAIGSPSAVQGDTATFSGGGMSLGAAGFVALSQGSDTALPHAQANTYGSAGGGEISTASTGTMSLDLPFGPTPVSAAASLTFVSAFDSGALSAQFTPQDEFSSLASPAYTHIA